MLEASKEWGCPPWVIWEGSAIWFKRWRFQRTQMDLKIDKDSKKKAK